MSSYPGQAAEPPPKAPGTVSGILWPMTGLLQYVDAVTLRVPDLDAGLAFYRGRLGHELIWRNDAVGQAGLRTPDSATEVVLTTTLSYEPNWKVRSAEEAAAVFVANGGRIVAGPEDIPIGRLVVVEDPFSNVLVLVDTTKGTYQTDAEGKVTGVA
jgi:predicted enzyme related to lactoylglutathione lyase